MHNQPTTITYERALRTATALLASSSPTARLDATLLLAHVCGVSRTRLLSEWETPLTADEQTQFAALVARRGAGEPVAYLVGHKEFYGHDFVVDARVLIPRPETELVIDLALATVADAAPSLSIADIGTGSGCIAVTLALALPTAHVWAVDLSADALAVARQNVARHGVAQRVTLLHGAGVALLPNPVNLLVSNPPYTILHEVEPNVARYEPHLALDGHGSAGLDIIAGLLQTAPPLLRPGGALLMEIGAWQGAAVLALARTAFPAAMLALHQDGAGRDRVLVVQT